MIRRARLTDIALIRKMADNAACLDCESLHVQGSQGTKNIIGATLGLSDSATTVVWCAEGGVQATAFAQFIKARPGESARVTCLGPCQDGFWPDYAISMLEGLVIEAGFAGLKSITAEVNESEGGFVSLRKAGFVVYIRQSVYSSMDIRWKTNTRDNSNVVVAKSQTEDKSEIYKLYNSIVPDLAKQAEETPSDKEVSYVIRNKDAMVGMFNVRNGPIGVWIKPYFYPEAGNEVGEVLANYVLSTIHLHKKPAYVRVRSYQPWLGGLLKDAGFNLLSTQAVMARRTTARVGVHEIDPIAKLVVSDADASIPVSKTINQDCLLSKQNERSFETRNS